MRRRWCGPDTRDARYSAFGMLVATVFLGAVNCREKLDRFRVLGSDGARPNDVTSGRAGRVGGDRRSAWMEVYVMKTPNITTAQLVALIGSVVAVVVAAGLPIEDELQDSIS